jgi:hypothetical protein
MANPTGQPSQAAAPPVQPRQPARGGRAAEPTGWRARQGRRVHADPGATAGKRGMTPLPLLPKNPRRGKHRRGHHLARGGGGSRARWTFPDRSPAAWIQKGRGAVRGEGKTNHPHWGFPPPRFGGGLGEEEGGRARAAAPRRWGKKAGGPCCCVCGTRREPRTGGAKRRGQRREHGPRRRVKGGARRRGHQHRRNAITPEPLRHAFVRPATSTPSPHREHHRGLSPLSPSPWSVLCCHDVETRRREPCLRSGRRAARMPHRASGSS